MVHHGEALAEIIRMERAHLTRLLSAADDIFANKKSVDIMRRKVYFFAGGFGDAELKQLLFGVNESDVNKIVLMHPDLLEGILFVERLRKPLNSITQKKERPFVKFINGIAQLPVEGFASRSVDVVIMDSRGYADSPWANTRDFTLYIPLFANDAVFKQRISYVIDESLGLRPH